MSSTNNISHPPPIAASGGSGGGGCLQLQTHYILYAKRMNYFNPYYFDKTDSTLILVEDAVIYCVVSYYLCKWLDGDNT